MCQEYFNFCKELRAYNIPKDRMDLMFEDGYSVQEAIDEWEWEQDLEHHEWAQNRKDKLTEMGLF